MTHFWRSPLAFSWMSVSVAGMFFFFLPFSRLVHEFAASREKGDWQGRGRGALGGSWGGVKQTAEGCTHTNTLRQSQISRKGLSIDWLDSRAAITYESNSREIRTVGGLMATLPLAPSLWQCQPMSRRRLVPPFKFDAIKISRYFLLLCPLLSFFCPRI